MRADERRKRAVKRPRVNHGNDDAAFEAAFAHIGDHADDARLAAAEAIHQTSDRVLPGPFAAGANLVHEGNVLRAGAVGVGHPDLSGAGSTETYATRAPSAESAA